MIFLMDLYAAHGEDREDWRRALYDLLAERTPEQSISHRRMPNWEDHLAFIDSMPYMAWYVLRQSYSDAIVGACYLTRQREIGLSVFKAHQRKGYGRSAVEQLMKKHPGQFLANINPANEASIALFRSLGFGAPIQITLRRDP